MGIGEHDVAGMSDKLIRSKWNDGSLHVAKWFGLISVHEVGITSWITLPLLWRVGVRFGRRDYVIDRAKPVHLWDVNASLYFPADDRRWVRTTIRGVEERARQLGYRIERSKPSPWWV